VLRGTYPVADGERRAWAGRPGAVGLQPIDPELSTAWTIRTDQVATWWATEPYSVLIATGYNVDCVELPSPLGHRIFDPLSAAAVYPPAMLTPLSTVVLFVRASRGPRPALTALSLRSTDSWVAVPPTEQGNGTTASSPGYRWLIPPESLDWKLPELADVNAVIERTILG